MKKIRWGKRMEWWKCKIMMTKASNVLYSVTINLF
jgi:hypothetical protein